MINTNFSEDKMKAFCEEAIPVMQELIKIAKKHGIEEPIRTYTNAKDDYCTVDSEGFDGWNLIKVKDEYRMDFRKSIKL